MLAAAAPPLVSGTVPPLPPPPLKWILSSHSGYSKLSLTRSVILAMDAETTAALSAAVAAMNGTLGFDFVIVCTSTPTQSSFWRDRLTATRGQAAKADARVYAVVEEWAADGAGNGLGTLFAYFNARSALTRDPPPPHHGGSKRLRTATTWTAS